MNSNIYEVFEQLFAGNLFPMYNENPRQTETRRTILTQIKSFEDKLDATMRKEFAQLSDNLLNLQGELEEASFNYGCEFAAAFLLRAIIGQDTYNDILNKLKP